MQLRLGNFRAQLRVDLLFRQDRVLRLRIARIAVALDLETPPVEAVLVADLQDVLEPLRAAFDDLQGTEGRRSCTSTAARSMTTLKMTT